VAHGEWMLPVPVVDVDVGWDDYWDEDLNWVVLVGPVLADRVRENGGLGTIPAVAGTAPDGNAENDLMRQRWSERFWSFDAQKQCECSISTCYSLLL
jgi:hypothetical protein